jgi:HAD superfamily hydrolase (TIGR01549 family)
MNSSQLQAIFFDFDGVLVESAKIKTDAFRTLFQEYERKTVDKIIRYHQQHAGISRVIKIEHIFNTILEQPLSKDKLEKLVAEYSRLVVERVISAPWIPGAHEFLLQLSPNVSLFIISGTPEPELQFITQQRNITHIFKEILGSPTKKPVHINNLLRNYHLHAENCVFIGDALNDLRAANETKIPFIGIQGEIAFPPDTLVLTDCHPLNEILEQLFNCG